MGRWASLSSSGHISRVVIAHDLLSGTISNLAPAYFCFIQDSGTCILIGILNFIQGPQILFRDLKFIQEPEFQDRVDSGLDFIRRLSFRIQQPEF
jgi:hypothetical protein